MLNWAKFVVFGLVCAAAPLAAQTESVFDFESVAAGTATPLALSVNGLTASFTGSAAICPSIGLSGNLFLGLTGNAWMQGFCSTSPNPTYGPMIINFSSPISKVSFALAINGTDPAPVTVTYLDHGISVGSQTLNPAVPNGGTLSPEIAVTHSGTFDSISISSAALLAIDNVDAIGFPTSPIAGR